MKKKIGITCGVYDMFHIGHLNIIKNAKEKCDFLIVAVSTDEVVRKNKNKTPIIPFKERMAIVEAIRYVDKVVPQTDYGIEGKIKMVIENEVDVMFVGSDWKGTEKWLHLEEKLKKVGCMVEYLPHTDGVSSTILADVLHKINDL